MARRALNAAGQVNEAAFQASVIGLLRVHGWRHIYHAPDNRPAGRTGRPQRLEAPEGKGFPDVVAVHERRARLLFAELKAQNGRIGPGQLEWLAVINEVGDAVARLAELADVTVGNLGGMPDPKRARVDAYLWRPSDWDELAAIIAGDDEPRGDLRPAWAPPAA